MTARIKIDPMFTKAGFEARHPTRSVTCKHDTPTAKRVRTTIFRPTMADVRACDRASAWPSDRPKACSLTGRITDIDATEGQVQIRVFEGGTKQHDRWFPISMVAEAWFY